MKPAAAANRRRKPRNSRGTLAAPTNEDARRPRGLRASFCQKKELAMIADSPHCYHQPPILCVSRLATLSASYPEISPWREEASPGCLTPFGACLFHPSHDVSPLLIRRLETQDVKIRTEASSPRAGRHEQRRWKLLPIPTASIRKVRHGDCFDQDTSQCSGEGRTHHSTGAFR